MKTIRATVKSKTEPSNKHVIWIKEDSGNNNYEVKIYNGVSWVNIDEDSYIELSLESGYSDTKTMSQKAITQLVESIKLINRGITIMLWYDPIEYNGMSSRDTTIHWNIEGYSIENIRNIKLYKNNLIIEDLNLNNSTSTIKAEINDIIIIEIEDSDGVKYTRSVEIVHSYPVFIKIKNEYGNTDLILKILSDNLVEYYNESIEIPYNGYIFIEYPEELLLLEHSSCKINIPMSKEKISYYEKHYWRSYSLQILKGSIRDFYIKLI